MSSIFISHRSTDRAVAAEVQRWLLAEGHRGIFLDYDPFHGIPAGCDWEREIYRQLRSCRAVVVLCSRAAGASKWCFAEISLARALGKQLLPVRLDDSDVPELLRNQQVVDLAGDRDAAFASLRRGLSAAGIDPDQAFDWDGTRPPYPGLLAFEESDAAVFFGRDAEITDGLAALNKARRLEDLPLVLVVGASGSGKSSVVRAGLVPRLRNDPGRWLVVGPVRPRDDPWRELAIAVSRAFAEAGEPRPWQELRDRIRCAPDPGPAFVEVAGELCGLAARPQARVLVVVDQFEELLASSAGSGAAAFQELLAGAVMSEGPGPILLATLRSDFLADLQERSVLAGVDAETVLVGPMSVEAVTQVIEEPARLAGIDLEPGLVQAIVADGRFPTALPLLAFALRELYERYGSDGMLTVSEYRDGLGGLDGSIARVADELVERTSPDDLDETRRAFLAMVRPSETGRWARQTVRWDDLAPPATPVLERFVTARLLVSSADDDVRTIEVAHEALFTAWDVLAGWLASNEADLLLRDELTRAAAGWRGGGRDTGDLWRGARLGRAVELIDAGDLPVDDRDREFVDASAAAERAAAEERARRRRRQLRTAVVFAGVTLVAALVAALLFVEARSESGRANDEADRATALRLAAESRALPDENPALALALAAESMHRTDGTLAEAQRALFDARAAFGDRDWQPVGGPLESHDGVVWSVDFDEHGTRLATAGADHTIRLWDPIGRVPIGGALAAHTDDVLDVAFGRGDVLASAGADSTVRLWDLADSPPVDEVLGRHDAPVIGVAFDASGTRLATATRDGTIRLFDTVDRVQTGPVLDVPGLTDAERVLGLDLSPDATLLAAARGPEVLVWDLSSEPPRMLPLGGHTERVYAVSFSPNGDVLATAGADGEILRWDPRSGAAVGEPLIGHTGTVFALAYDHAGERLASASADDTVRVWDVGDDPGPPAVVTGHAGSVYAVSFSPGGSLVATGGVDRTVRLWDPRPGTAVARALAGHAGEVLDVSFSPDGATLVTGGRDATVRLWDPVTGAALDDPLGHDHSVRGVAKDGDTVAAALTSGSVVVWDLTTDPPTKQELAAHSDAALAVAISPVGTRLASAGMDGDVVLRDLTADPASVLRLRGAHDGSVYDVAFDGDGTRLATAGADGSVVIWDLTVDPPTPAAQLEGHEGAVWGVAFGPDGTRLASAGTDGTARLWDLTVEPPVDQVLGGHELAVFDVAFDHDGTLLATSGRDGVVRLWDPASGTPIGQPLPGQDGDAVWAVAFDPVTGRLATGSDDAVVRLWDRIWDVEESCALFSPAVDDQQVAGYLPPGDTPEACP